MFSLIVAIVSIALVVALVAASGYFGGSAVTEARAQADATRLMTEENHIFAGMDLFRVEHHRWPLDVQELVDKGYLRTIPQGVSNLAAAAPSIGILRYLPAAYADAGAGWGMPVSGQPLLTTVTKVPKLTCQKYNKASRGDDGILRKPFVDLAAQCYGEAGSYQVVVRKSAAIKDALAEAVAPVIVAQGGLPSLSAGVSWWDTSPTGALTSPVDADKSPFTRLAMRATAVQLGSVQVGKRAKSALVQVVNEGHEVASSLKIQPPTGFDVVDNTCQGSLPVASSCNFALSFTPVAPVAFNGEVSVGSSNGGVLSAAVNAVGVAASGRLTSSLEFGSLPAGANLIRDVLMENTGIGSINLGTPAVQGDGFALINGGTCGSVLDVGASCTVRVELRAVEDKLHLGSVEIQTEAGIKIAHLTGQSLAARLSLQKTEYNFGQVQSGDSMLSSAFILANNGNTASSGLLLTDKPGFTVVNNTCKGTLGAGGECSFNVEFTPTGQHLYSAVVDVANGLQVSLNGQGMRADASLPNFDFGSVAYNASITKPLQVTNTGIGTLSLGSIGAANLIGENYSFNSTNCGATLAKGASCQVYVTLSSPGIGQSPAGQLWLDTGAGVLRAALTASGVFDGDYFSYRGPVFGGGGGATIMTRVNTWGQSDAPFQFVNISGIPLSNLMVRFTGNGFRAVQNTCTGTIQPGQTCQFKIEHYSSTVGNTKGTVMLYTTGYMTKELNMTGSAA